VLVVVGAVAGLVLIVAVVWGLLKFLPSGNTQLADGTPAPAGSSWVKFTLPDGSASALFPGEVKSNSLPNGAVSHMASVNGNGFALSDKSPMEVSENFLERTAESKGEPGDSDNETNQSLETINGNRCLKRTVKSNGDLSQVMVTFVHNRRMYVAVVTKGPQSSLSPSDADYFLKSVTFH
jgi:hypothetical protein